MKKKGKILLSISEKLIGGIIYVILYIPIILGILAPMFTLIGFELYISWYLIGPTFTDWTWSYYLIPSELIPFYIFIEIIIFCFGLGLFLTGLITMIQKKVHGAYLVESGIYKYIRHPQNLGIIIMSFPFTLYIPGFEDIGIRMGEIASWMFFAFFILCYSYFEEWRLMKRYNDLFQDYYNKTGFFIPKIFQNKEKPLTLKKLFVRIGISIIIFIILFILFYSFVLLFEDYLIRFK